MNILRTMSALYICWHTEFMQKWFISWINDEIKVDINYFGMRQYMYTICPYVLVWKSNELFYNWMISTGVDNIFFKANNNSGVKVEHCKRVWTYGKQFRRTNINLFKYLGLTLFTKSSFKIFILTKYRSDCDFLS